MFTDLKRAINMEAAEDVDNADLATDDIKDPYLDDPETVVVGAENDPEIKEFIENIPESDDLDEVGPNDINRLIKDVAESELPEDEVDDADITKEADIEDVDDLGTELQDVDESFDDIFMEADEELEDEDTMEADEEFDDIDEYGGLGDDEADDSDLDDIYDEFIDDEN